jgi:hypothetical protein
MANIITHKRSNIEEKKPQSSALALGELAVNLHDGNIYLKKSNNTIAEMKRLDERLNTTDVTLMSYNNEGDLIEVEYITGNKTVLNYTSGDLTSVDYYATNGTTHLFTQTLNYNENGNLISTEWTEV